jgi:hypothetical protein
MRIKLSLGVVVFLLILANCSLFEDPPVVNITEPKEEDILVRGESFNLIAEIDADYGLHELSVELWLPDGITENPYDSILWSYNVSDEGVDFIGKIEIEKEIMVPFDAPIDDSYYLQIHADNWGGGNGYTWSVPVSVLASNY